MHFIFNIQREKESRMTSRSRSENISLGRTCFDIQTSAHASVRIMSKHVALDWYFPIWNSRSFLILIVWHHLEWRHTVWRHVVAFFLCSACGEKDCSINMLNINKLRFIVYEIFDNSQLFLTDPRIWELFAFSTNNTL